MEFTALFLAVADRAAPQAAAGAFAHAAVWLVIGLTALNVVSALLECGLAACAEDPVVYELLKPW